MTPERLQELRAEHRPGWLGCITCMRWVDDETACEQSQILDMALETDVLWTKLGESAGATAKAMREAERLRNTGVRADERREMQKAVAETQAAEMKATKAEAEAERLRAAIRDVMARWPTDLPIQFEDELRSALVGTEATHG